MHYVWICVLRSLYEWECNLEHSPHSGCPSWFYWAGPSSVVCAHWGSGGAEHNPAPPAAPAETHTFFLSLHYPQFNLLTLAIIISHCVGWHLQFSEFSCCLRYICVGDTTYFREATGLLEGEDAEQVSKHSISDEFLKNTRKRWKAKISLVELPQLKGETQNTHLLHCQQIVLFFDSVEDTLQRGRPQTHSTPEKTQTCVKLK